MKPFVCGLCRTILWPFIPSLRVILGLSVFFAGLVEISRTICQSESPVTSTTEATFLSFPTKPGYGTKSLGYHPRPSASYLSKDNREEAKYEIPSQHLRLPLSSLRPSPLQGPREPHRGIPNVTLEPTRITTGYYRHNSREPHKAVVWPPWPESQEPTCARAMAT